MTTRGAAMGTLRWYRTWQVIKCIERNNFGSLGEFSVVDLMHFLLWDPQLPELRMEEHYGIVKTRENGSETLL